MVIERTQRVWAFLTAAALVLMTLGGGLLVPRFAHADVQGGAEPSQSAPIQPAVDTAPAKMADAYKPNFIGAGVERGETVTLNAPTFEDANKRPIDAPAGVQYSIDEKTDSRLHARIDGQGVITVAPDANLNADFYNVFVTVTYADGTSDFANFTVNVTALWDIVYTPANVEVLQGETRTLTPQLQLDGAPKNTPTTTVFAIESGSSNNDVISIDPTNGNIAVNATDNAELKTYVVKVTATTGSVIARGTVTITIAAKETAPKVPSTPQKDMYQPAFTGDKVDTGAAKTLAAPEFTDAKGVKTAAPRGVQYAIVGEKTSAVMHARINDKGEITVAPEPGVATRLYNIFVMVTYEDGSSDEVSVGVFVDTPWDIGYTPADVEVRQGETQTLTPKIKYNGKDQTAPNTTVYAFEGDSPHPAITLDSKTGVIAVAPATDAAIGQFNVRVNATNNGRLIAQGDVNIKIVAKPVAPAPQPPAPAPEKPAYKFSYDDLAVTQGETESVELKVTLDGKKSSAPADVSFTRDAKMPDWITVDAKTGVITATTDEYVPAETYNYMVTVTQADGAKTEVPVMVKVAKAGDAPELKSQLWKLSYADTTLQQLKSATVKLTATLFGKERALPRGVTFAPGADMPSWVTVDEKTGAITVKPSEFVEIKSYVFHVVVTHLNGETEKLAVNIKVTEADAQMEEPQPQKPGKVVIPALKLTPATPHATPQEPKPSDPKPSDPKPTQPKPVETPSTGLAKTGVGIAGLAGTALLAALAGAAMLRRRKA
ncbi:YPDG domain-containing protein [Arcanobacterium phocisimile]|uniref:YPDG domain-containing protein n=1 Tax=Arcanobacterium phocisimile TaxID=1302235 RepID=A0ABX7IIM4_9ACTO|nr:Rib/alpha-like domain-containing protein [Arcanobacterium phocisimile]QRV02807.1 YPDG domain-containing protein [Arcanobacterium phocisimile]